MDLPTRHRSATSASRPLFGVLIGALAACGLAGGCSPAESRGTLSQAISTTVPSPLTRQIVESLGSTISEVQVRVDMARFEIRKKCLMLAGFAIREESPPQDLDLFDPRGYARSAVQRIEVGQVTQGSVAQGDGSDNEEYVRADESCSAAAAEKIVDPTQELLRWIRESLKDVESSVKADNRQIIAHQTLDACLGGMGQSIGDVSSAEGEGVRLTEEVLNLYRDRKLSKEAAVARLLDLAASQERSLADSYACIDAYSATISAVQAEYESAFLDTNLPALRQRLEEAKALLG